MSLPKNSLEIFSLSFLIHVHHQVLTFLATKYVSSTSSPPQLHRMAPSPSHPHLLSKSSRGPPKWWPAPNLAVLYTPQSGRNFLKHSRDYHTPLIPNCALKIQSKSITTTQSPECHLAASSRNILPLTTVASFTPASSSALSTPSPFLPGVPHTGLSMPCCSQTRPLLKSDSVLLDSPPLPQGSLFPVFPRLRCPHSLPPIMSPATV